MVISTLISRSTSGCRWATISSRPAASTAAGLVITDFAVTGGGPFVGVSFDQSDPAAPLIENSNFGDGTLGGPTNLEGAFDSVGPQITPQDTQGCADPENFWTPNC